MRMIRALRALYHSSRALRLQRLADAHGSKAQALLGRTTLNNSKNVESCGITPEVDEVAPHPAERVLLASIVGLGLAGIWLGILWRAA